MPELARVFEGAGIRISIFVDSLDSGAEEVGTRDFPESVAGRDRRLYLRFLAGDGRGFCQDIS